MTNTEPDNLVHKLLSQEPSEVQTWLRCAWEGQCPIPHNFNWHGLADVAAANARDTLNLDWAEISVSVYDYLCRIVPDNCASWTISAMTLRAFLIMNMGPVAGSTILDPELIFTWVLASLPGPLSDVRQQIAPGREWLLEQIAQRKPNALEQVRELRRLKNRLSVIQGLSDEQILPPDHELQAWLALRPELP